MFRNWGTIILKVEAIDKTQAERLNDGACWPARSVFPWFGRSRELRTWNYTPSSCRGRTSRACASPTSTSAVSDRDRNDAQCSGSPVCTSLAGVVHMLGPGCGKPGRPGPGGALGRNSRNPFPDVQQPIIVLGGGKKREDPCADRAQEPSAPSLFRFRLAQHLERFQRREALGTFDERHIPSRTPGLGPGRHQL